MAIVAPRYTPTGTLPSAMPTPQVRAQSGLAEGLAAIGDTIATLGKSAQYVKEKVERDEAIQQSRIEAQTRANEVAGTHAALQWKERNEARLAKFYQSRGGNVYNDYDTWVKDSETDTGDDLKKDLSPEAVAAFDRQVSLWRQDFNTKASTHAANQHRGFTVETTTKAQETYVASAADALSRLQENEGQQFIASAVQQAMNRQTVTGEEVDVDAIGADARISALGIIAKSNAATAVAIHDKWATAGAYGKYADKAEKLMAPVKKEARARYFADDISADRMVTADGNFNIQAAMSLLEAESEMRNIPPDERDRITQLLEERHNFDVEQRKQFSKREFSSISEEFITNPSGGDVIRSKYTTTDKDGKVSMTEYGARAMLRMPVEDRGRLMTMILSGPTVTDAGAKQAILSKITDYNEDVGKIQQFMDKSVLSNSDRVELRAALQKRVKEAGTPEHEAMTVAKGILLSPGGVLWGEGQSKEDKESAKLQAHALADMAVQAVKQDKLPLSRSNIEQKLAIITAQQSQAVGGILGAENKSVFAANWEPKDQPEQMDIDAAKREFPSASPTQITRLAVLKGMEREERNRIRREKAEAIVVSDDADAGFFAQRIKDAKTKADLDRVIDQTNAWLTRSSREDPYDRTGYLRVSRQNLERMLEIKKKLFEP